jgi:MFS family permease
MSTTRSRPWEARLAPHLAVASVGYVVFALAAVPGTVTGRLGVGLGSFGIVVSAALGAFVLAQPVASRLTRRHATPRLLLWGTATHAGLAVLLDLAGSFPALVALRVAWGLAGGFVLSVGATQIARLFAGTAATRQQGVYGGVLTLGGAVGFLAAPNLVDAGGVAGVVGAGGVAGLVHTLGALLAVPAVVLSRRTPAATARATATATPATGGERPTTRAAGERTGTGAWPGSRTRTEVETGSRTRTEVETNTDTEAGAATRHVLGDPVVLLAGLSYVAIIGSYVTLSTFVTAYYADLGVAGPLNAFVLVAATAGRAAGGVVVGSTSDALVIGGGTAVAAGSFGALASGLPTALVAVVPLVAMLGVSVPFGSVFAVAGRATGTEGTALAFVVGVGNVAALVLPAATGALYDATDGYAAGFALLAGVNVVAVAGAAALARRTGGDVRRDG